MASPLVVLIPVFEDWEVLGLLLPRLGEMLAAAGRVAELLVVDDGSTTAAVPALPAAGFSSGQVLRLRRNLGHQRAIAVGLCWIGAHRTNAVTVVLDADGEDDPADVPRLLAAFDAAGGESAVFAARMRRAESAVFQAGYHAYRWLHQILVGKPVRIGNFSVLPWDALRRLVVSPEVWNHYAAAVVRGRIPRVEIPTHRARRLAGHSSMNLVSLVTHGLSAISVYADIVGVRLLIGSMVATGLALGMAAWVISSGAPGSWPVLLLAGATFHGASLAALGAFVTLASRQHQTFLPERDAPFLIDRTEPLG